MCFIIFPAYYLNHYADPFQDYKNELFIDIKKERETKSESFKKTDISLSSLKCKLR